MGLSARSGMKLVLIRASCLDESSRISPVGLAVLGWGDCLVDSSYFASLIPVCSISIKQLKSTWSAFTADISGFDSSWCVFVMDFSFSNRMMRSWRVSALTGNSADSLSSRVTTDSLSSRHVKRTVSCVAPWTEFSVDRIGRRSGLKRGLMSGTISVS